MTFSKTLVAALAAATIVAVGNASVIAERTYGNKDPAYCTSQTSFMYVGCFNDAGGDSRTLPYGYSNFDDPNMTLEMCIKYCKANDYQYAGVEYYGECFCGASVSGSIASDQSSCSYPCRGNSSEICGGDSVISVYEDTTFPVVDDTVISDFQSMGCWTDPNTNGRTLVYRQDQVDSSTLTTEKCLAACKTGGFAFAGTEYSGECYCGVVLGNGTTSVDASNCNTPCNGDSSETCGGPSFLNLYVAADLQSTNPCTSEAEPTTVTANTLSHYSTTCSSYTASPSSYSTTKASSTFYSAFSTSSSYTTSPSTSSSPAMSTTSSSLSATVLTSSSSTSASTTSCSVVSTSSSSTVASPPSSSSTSTSYSSVVASSSSSVISSASSSAASTSSFSTSASTTTSSSTSVSSPPSPASSTYSSSSSITAPSTTSSLTTTPISTTTSSSTIASLTSTSIVSLSSTTSSSIRSSTLSSTSSSTSAPLTTTSSLSSSTTSKPTTITASASICTATSTTTTCEYGCGSWCASTLPDFSNASGCKIAVNSCLLQVASCYITAGWPGSLKCAEFASWCGQISSYCSSSSGCAGGSCSKSDCEKKNPPSGGSSSTSTTIYSCATTTMATQTSTTSTKTSAPVPPPTNICTQASHPTLGYSSSSPVGGIAMPYLTCNNVQSEFNAGYQLKLYTSSNTNSCSKYPKSLCSSGCYDACKAQYNSCVGTYAQSCSGQQQSSSQDSYDSAKARCGYQYNDCIVTNQFTSASSSCGTFNMGWKF